MRQLATLLLAFSLLAAQAQRLSISDLLLITHCEDTACVETFAGPRGLRLMGGTQEDGWIWFPRDHIIGDSLLDREHVVTLGFHGYPNCGGVYTISTRDTVYAARLTEELEQLGTEKGTQLYELQRYCSPRHPELEFERQEKRAASIVPKRKSDPKSRFNKPLGGELPEDMAAELREQGYDSYDLIPDMLWQFRIIVRK
ncbi:MAG: hypothetical protein WAU70_16655 [Flavobacteriales bacterium]